MAATEIARVGKNQIRTLLKMLPIIWHHVTSYDGGHHMMAKNTSYDGKKTYDGVCHHMMAGCHHMMSYDAM